MKRNFPKIRNLFMSVFQRNSSLDSPVRFVNSKSRVLSKCPVCFAMSNDLLLFVEDQNRKLPLIKCRCGTLFYPGAVSPDYKVVENRASFFMRIDQAEGIDSSLMPLFSSPSLNMMRVLDVGCGLGFTSDFVRFQGRDCIAFDPSSAAKLSTEFLKIDIFSEFGSIRNANRMEPALAFASEVIEHVDNPLAFLQDIHQILGNNGFLIATTPNADYVNIENPKNTIFSILAPSQHLFLLSKKSFSDLAKIAGFTWVKTWVVEERLILIAGPEEVSISNSFSRDKYIQYLEHRIQNSEIDNVIRYRTFGYRLFKEYVHSSNYSLATELFENLSNAYLSMGFDLNDPSGIVPWMTDMFEDEYIAKLHKANPKVIFHNPKNKVWGYELDTYAPKLNSFILAHYEKVPLPSASFGGEDLYLRKDSYSHLVSILKKNLPLFFLYKEDFSTSSLNQIPIGELRNGISIKQIFRTKYDNFAVITVQVATYKRTNECILNERLLDELGNTLASQKIECKALKDNSPLALRFSPIKYSSGKSFSLIFECSNAEVGNSITLWASPGFYKKGFHLYVNGFKSPNTLVLDAKDAIID